MDEGYVRAVLKYFVHLYDRGLLYRDNRIVNWCPRCASAISDLEVNHTDENDTLYTDPLPARGRRRATSRSRPCARRRCSRTSPSPCTPRTSATATSSGKEAILPVADRRDPDRRRRPRRPRVRHRRGEDHARPRPDGLRDRPHARAAGAHGDRPRRAHERGRGRVRRARAEGGRRSASSRGSRSRACSSRPSRTGTRSATATAAARASSRSSRSSGGARWTSSPRPRSRPCEDGRVVFRPERYTKIYLDWMESIRPWCVSRQLWWGHRIPVWYCPDGHLTVAESEPEACAECGSTELTPGRGRPRHVVLLAALAVRDARLAGRHARAPRAGTRTTSSSTDRGIIFLWEARMIMAGLELMGEIPFHTVNIHSTINAPDGRRMSKSLGTGIDPLEPIEQHGADATRYGLLKNSSTQDVKFSYGTIEEGRKLANKLWNVSRLILQHAEGVAPARRAARARGALDPRADRRDARGGRGRLGAATSSRPSTAALYRLVFDDFCDWYAEAVKPRLYEREPEAVATALAALERVLTLLHPVMPHVTEEIWTALPARETRLIVVAVARARRALRGATRARSTACRRRRRSSAGAASRSSSARTTSGASSPRSCARIARAVDGNREAELERLRKEVARGEGMLANERFVAERAGRGRRGRAREARALPPRARRRSKARRNEPPRTGCVARKRGARPTRTPPWVGSWTTLHPRRAYRRSTNAWDTTSCRFRKEFSTGGLALRCTRVRDRVARLALALAARRLRGRAHARAAGRARRPAGRLPGDPRRRHERQVDGDGHDRGAAPARGALGRLHDLAARRELERAHPGRRRGGRLRGGGRARARGGRAARTRRSSRSSLRPRSPPSRHARVDVAVVEAGLGGRLDATNVLRTRVVLLTNVALEHTDVLGDTVEEIAREKLAVAPPGRASSSSRTARSRSSSPAARSSSAERTRPRRRSSATRSSEAPTPALPGRLERRESEIRDGAHNPAGVRYLVERLVDRASSDFTVVVSILADKDADAMLARPSASGAPTRCDAVVVRARASGRRAGGARARTLRRTSRRSRARSRLWLGRTLSASPCS